MVSHWEEKSRDEDICGCRVQARGGGLEPFEANSVGCSIELEIWSLEIRTLH